MADSARSRRVLTRTWHYLFAVLVTALMVALRWLLDPWLGDRLALVTMYAAVAAAVWLGGYRPAALATVLGFFAVDFLFVPPRGVFDPFTFPNLVGLLGYGLSCAIIIVGVEAAQRARKQADERRELLRITLSSIGDAVITTDRAGRITDMNAVAETLTGWHHDEARGLPLETVFEAVTAREREPMQIPSSRVLGQGAVVNTADDAILIARNGSERLIDSNAAPIRSRTDEVVGCVLVFRDVTARRRAEADAREAHSRLESTLAAVEIGTWEFDLQTGRVRADPNLARMFGVSGDEAEGGPLEAYARAIHPEDRAAVMRHVEQVLRSGDTYEAEYRLVGRAASEPLRWVAARGRIERDASGRAIRLPGVVMDITSRRLAEAERDRVAAASERQRRVYETALSNTPDLHSIVDLEGRFLYVNRPLAEMLGRHEQEIVGRTLRELDHPPERSARFDHELRLVIEGGRPLRRETTYPHAEGERHLEYIMVPVHGAGGAVEAVAVSTRDTTERRRGEAALRASEARFRQLADAMPQIVWMARPDGGHEHFNRRWYEYTGCPPARSLDEAWVETVHPGDRALATERWAHALTTGDPYEVECRLRAANGDHRWFLTRALPVRDDGGRIVAWFGTCTDVEDFKRVEGDRQKLALLAAHSSDFIGMCDAQLMPFYINRAGLDMVGLDSMEQASRTNVRDFFFEEDRSYVIGSFLPSVLESGDGEIEVRFRHFKTGAALWMSYRVFAVRDAEGERVGLATVSRDITQRRQLNDHLRRLAADLSEADRRKNDFLATLAHELRNPLAPIRNGLQILGLAQHDPGASANARQMMERQLGQLVRLVDDLLDVSRITNNKLELRKEPMDLAGVIHHAVETSRPSIEAGGHELVLTLAPTPVIVDADLTRLGQVFANLLNNAAKFTEPGGRIELSVQRQQDQVNISVKDSGVGMSPTMLPSVFDMFSQGERNSSRAQGGLGIGLTLVKRLVAMHGGSVEARSGGPGQGSEFIVRLPVAAGAHRDAPESPAAGLCDPATEPCRVLVADDNADAATSLAMMLELMGNEVRTAHDGLEAVQVAESFRPELVLLDIGMPQLNGYEACRRIRARPHGQDVVVAALSGWGQDEDKRKSHAAGFDRHLTKPLQPGDLEALLASAAERRQRTPA
jgi:PAS domain S-box-containing protein